MPVIADERQALIVATEFVKYKNAVDEAIYGVDSPRPRYDIDPNTEAKKVGMSIVFTAVPRVAIVHDDPKSEHHIERRKSVIVHVYSSPDAALNVPFLEAAWRGKIPDEKLNELTSDVQIWTELFTISEKPRPPRGMLG